MGDRGNIIIEKDDRHFLAPLYFYTHWSGSSIQPILQRALKVGKGRWNDPSYLARIIFCTLVGPKPSSPDTGFGISNTLCDNSHQLLCVNIPENKVRLRETPRWDSESDPLSGKVIQEWTFEEYLAATFDEEE